MSGPPINTLHSAIYEGWVRHRRYANASHRFRYRMFQMYLDLGELETLFDKRWFWSINKPNVASFRRRDYFGDPSISIDQAVRDRVQSELGVRPTGPIRLLTHLRYFGVGFNPVSFYYGFEDDGQTLAWILAEITNTPWNQRHAYLLPVTQAQQHGRALHWQFDKAFHVSPFLPMDRHYDWRFEVPGDSLRVHMNVSGQQRDFDATLTMQRKPLNANTLASCLARYPYMCMKVIFGIYWQAFLLTCKRVPFFAHPNSTHGNTLNEQHD